MRFEELLHRVAFGGEGTDRRLAWAIIGCVLLLYAVAFVSFYPRGATNTDEATYIRQARLLVQGTTSVSKIDPLTGDETELVLARHPAGTALSLAPFVVVGGWRAVFVAPLVFLLAGILVTARWLQEEGRSPIFALIILGFPASLVLGRVASSEPPSVFLVSLGLWLFWRGRDGGALLWLASGFIAATSTIVREPNVLPFVAFFAGTVLRREANWWALLVGGLVGVGVRLLETYLTFGDPLFVRAAYHFAPHTIGERLPIYLLGLLVFVPGGLVFSLLYRGRRWPELVITVALFFLFYLTQTHGGTETSFVKRIVNALRYFVPLLPVMAFAMAESVPRLWSRLVSGRLAARRSRLETLGSAVLVVWIGGCAAACVVTHWAFDRWSATQVAIRDEIHGHTGDESVLVTNLIATTKFIRYLDRTYLPVDREQVSVEAAATLAGRYGEFFVAFLDRTDSEYHRREAERNAAFIAALSPPPRLELDRRFTATDRLRIWRVTTVEH